MRILFLALLLLATAACAPTPGNAAPPTAGAAATAEDDAGRMLGDIGRSAAPGAVDTSCTTDADCTVKNVGNCCGEFPSCVNVDSPTFPEQVQAACGSQGRMSVCGFREVAGCSCVDGRCSNEYGSARGVEPVVR
ncbi:hypothetical protein [Coralloluteibacterium stylophorae]|uniref:hypothetical protein n=1 Tax=Coralloluteibacterium stylophorae TaxID=1776034 RepID=UPI001FECC079|nr:hypothetical protein [Coralloluteibacterium stylophorae]